MSFQWPQDHIVLVCPQERAQRLMNYGALTAGLSAGFSVLATVGSAWVPTALAVSGVLIGLRMIMTHIGLHALDNSDEDYSDEMFTVRKNMQHWAALAGVPEPKVSREYHPRRLGVAMMSGLCVGAARVGLSFCNSDDAHTPAHEFAHVARKDMQHGYLLSYGWMAGAGLLVSGLGLLLSGKPGAAALTGIFGALAMLPAEAYFADETAPFREVEANRIGMELSRSAKYVEGSYGGKQAVLDHCLEHKLPVPAVLENWPFTVDYGHEPKACLLQRVVAGLGNRFLKPKTMPRPS